MYPISFEKFSDLFLGGAIISVVAICIINAALISLASTRGLLVAQQSGYKTGETYKRYAADVAYKNRFMLLSLMSFLAFCLINACFIPAFGENVSSFIGFFAYILFIAIYVKTERGAKVKVPLKKTARLIRLVVTYFILNVIVTFIAAILLNLIAYAIKSDVLAVMRFAPIVLCPMLAPYLLVAAEAINLPFENARNKRFIARATKILDECSAVKIGVTGSFGKTSVKEILKTLLSEKYSVLATPQSYNTPLGIALTVKDGVNADYFIAEAGARHKGDIKEICGIVKPSIGVLTGINGQHVETFGDEKAVKAAKFELFENLRGDKIAVFSADSDGSRELFNKFVGDKSLAGIKGDFVRAENVRTSSAGSSFTLLIKGEEPIRCKTSLLGKHNVSDIVLAAAVAYKCGLSVDEIARGIEKCSPTEHRCSIIKAEGGGTIIDDTYNSNEDGARAALKTLSLFKGRKTVITAGLVELGKREDEANENLGKSIAEHADEVIIVGNVNKETLKRGATDGGLSGEAIKFAETLEDAVTIKNGVNAGEVVLFLNDLPDKYK